MVLRFHFTELAEANGAEGEGQSSVLSMRQAQLEHVALKEYVGNHSLCLQATAVHQVCDVMSCHVLQVFQCVGVSRKTVCGQV